jgi:DNA-binding MarR family transcriptional regulator
VEDRFAESDYRSLSDFRFELRKFLRFSEEAAHAAGLTAQQHQALLAIRAGNSHGMLIGELADRLLLRPHSVSELVDRLEAHQLVTRAQDQEDRRQVSVQLTDLARDTLASLSSGHRAELRRLRPLLQRLLQTL